MIRMNSCAFVVSLLLSAANSWASDFSKDIAPILLDKCVTCHNPEKAKGGFRVDTFSALIQPGKSKEPSIVPGKPEESELFKRITTEDEDDRMPQKGDPLSTPQIESFRQWITDGAKLDRGDALSNLALLAPKHPHPKAPEYYRMALPVLALAFTPDATEIATGGYHEVIFWNLEGQIQSRVTNVPERVHSIAFQPGATVENRRFALAGGKPGRSGEVSVYEAGVLLTNLLVVPDEMLTVAFSADGKLLACGGSDNSIHLFQTSNWEKLLTIQQHADWVTSVNFNSDATKIISASRDRTARIYDASSGELETTYNGHGAALYGAAFVSESMAASGGKEKIVHWWDLKEGKKSKEFSDAGGEIQTLLSADDMLFVAAADGKVRQYSVKEKKLERTFSGSRDAVYAIARADGRLAAGDYSGQVTLWNTKDREVSATFVAAPLASKKPVASAQ
jgi:WD40 repeat protein